MKSRYLFLLLVLLLLAIMAGPVPLWAEESGSPDESVFFSDPSYLAHPYKVQGRILVDFKDDTPYVHIQKLEKDLGVSLKPVSNYSQKFLFMGTEVDEYRSGGVLSALKNDPAVEYAEPDYYYHIMGDSVSAPVNDPLYKYQWNFDKINVPQAWSMARGEGVIVAVIDTGVAYRDSGRFHRLEDLEGTRFVRGYNFVDKNDQPFDDHAHGSHVAGTIAQTTNNGKGVAGIAYNSKIMPLKVLGANGFGRTSDIADAVRFAADNGAKVINMSLGGPFPSLALKSACDYAYAKGVVIVCAAGNSRSTRPSYPAAYSSCLSVSSTRFDDNLAPYSNRGPDVGIAAPGGDTTVDQNNDGKPDGIMQNTIMVKTPDKEGYYIFQGTSMASPHVAGVAALLISSGVTDNREVIKILKKTARKKGLDLSSGYGAGIVDAKKALESSTLNRGWIKLLIAVVVLIIILLFLGSGAFSRIALSPQFYISWIIGGFGLFFLPLLIKADFFGKSLLSREFAGWDSLIFGAGANANPLFFSVLIPFALGAVLYKTRFQRLAAGFAAGMAGALLYALLFSSADVRWIPGTFILDKLYLLLNFAGSAVLAAVLIKTAGKKPENEGGEV